jgi:superfamily I DNA and/or RNA helicase
MAGKKELESAVASLATRLDDDLTRLQREAADFEKRREQLSRVTENFHPVRDHFDVLIVDEASQEDVVGLAPFYMADKIIVVGDDEQVTPLDVGGEQQPIQDLIGQWLTDLPSPLLFDLRTSIYDRAQIAFGSTIRLKEHFRCVPEIIQFSNHLSYGGDIKPLRESVSRQSNPRWWRTGSRASGSARKMRRRRKPSPP